MKAIRSTLESLFLNREVTLTITGLSEGLQGYIINNDEEDMRKVLLRNGYAKLGKDAMSGITTK